MAPTQLHLMAATVGQKVSFAKEFLQDISPKIGDLYERHQEVQAERAAAQRVPGVRSSMPPLALNISHRALLLLKQTENRFSNQENVPPIPDDLLDDALNMGCMLGIDCIKEKVLEAQIQRVVGGQVDLVDLMRQLIYENQGIDGRLVQFLSEVARHAKGPADHVDPIAPILKKLIPLAGIHHLLCDDRVDASEILDLVYDSRVAAAQSSTFPLARMAFLGSMATSLDAATLVQTWKNTLRFAGEQPQTDPATHQALTAMTRALQHNDQLEGPLRELLGQTKPHAGFPHDRQRAARALVALLPCLRGRSMQLAWPDFSRCLCEPTTRDAAFTALSQRQIELDDHMAEGLWDNLVAHLKAPQPPAEASDFSHLAQVLTYLVRQLPKQGLAPELDDLMDLATHPNLSIRCAATAAIGQYANQMSLAQRQTVWQALLSCLHNDASPNMQAAAATALAELAPLRHHIHLNEVWWTLIHRASENTSSLFTDPFQRPRRRLAEAMQAEGVAPTTAPQLLELLGGELSPGVRAAVLLGLADLVLAMDGADAATPALLEESFAAACEASEHAEPRLCRAGLEALGTLAGCLEAPQRKVAWQLCQNLWTARPPTRVQSEAEQALAALLTQSPAAEVKAALDGVGAALPGPTPQQVGDLLRQLGRIAHADSLPPLWAAAAELTLHPDPSVRQAAADGLRQMLPQFAPHQLLQPLQALAGMCRPGTPPEMHLMATEQLDKLVRLHDGTHSAAIWSGLTQLVRDSLSPAPPTLYALAPAG